MTATVHAGALTRRLEALCRIRIEKLDSVIVSRASAFALNSKATTPPRQGGVYVFWWTGDMELLTTREKEMILKGPGGRDVRIEMDDEWLGIEAGYAVPLYAGKTADSIRRRLGKHLLLGSRTKVIEPGRRKTKPPTTSCQLRSGVERLFPNVRTPIDLIRENIGMSYVVLDGDEHAANRFYLEDLAIGWMRPALNIDVER